MASPSPITASLYVALGGGAGSVLRYQFGKLTLHWIGARAATAFPWATLGVNILGSLAMGLLVGVLARSGSHGETWRLLIGVGLLGGFTTFSSFSMEMVLLVQRGMIGLAVTYAAASLVAGIGAMALGLGIVRALA